MSIEITRECPLTSPGCYAYGDNHLGGGIRLRELQDLRGQALVDKVLKLVRRHRPLQVSFVGGEPPIRRRELDQILPQLSDAGVFSLIVTRGVVPWPTHWSEIPGVRVAVSVDGLQLERRAPATYDRILKNISGRKADISWVITNQMMHTPEYLDKYLAFWTARGSHPSPWSRTQTHHPVRSGAGAGAGSLD